MSGDRAVKIELAPERSLLLPHDQFTFSELTGDDREQRLRLVFATHEVLVRGTCLRRIESAMQREGLSLLTRLPEFGDAINRTSSYGGFVSLYLCNFTLKIAKHEANIFGHRHSEVCL